jgi:hypothetical protein
MGAALQTAVLVSHDSVRQTVSLDVTPNTTTGTGAALETAVFISHDSDKPNASSGATSKTTTDTGAALKTEMLVLNGVLLVCTIVGAGFILVQLLKKLRKTSEASEKNEVCVALTQTGSSVRVSPRVSLESTFPTGHIYETID